MALGSALYLDESAAAVHDHVHVRFRVRIFGVVQVEHRCAAVDAHGHGRDLAVEWVRAYGPPLQQSVDGIRQGHEPASDGRRSSTAVRLQHIAIDGDGAFPKPFEVHHRSQGPADQALDLLSAAGLLAARRLACRTRVGRARQHAVLGGDPPLRLAAQE